MTVTVTVLDWPESAACVVCASCAMVGGVSEARLGVERIFTPRVSFSAVETRDIAHFIRQQLAARAVTTSRQFFSKNIVKICDCDRRTPRSSHEDL